MTSLKLKMITYPHSQNNCFIVIMNVIREEMNSNYQPIMFIYYKSYLLNYNCYTQAIHFAWLLINLLMTCFISICKTILLQIKQK